MNGLFAFCSSFVRNLSRGPNLYRSSLRADRFLVWWMIICILVRLWLVEAIDLIATFSPADEELFVSLAKHILNGEWLGPYNHYTLVKGPGFTAAFSALNNKFYGAPVIVELKTPEFNRALGGLMNIDGLGSRREYPVSLKSQDAAFEASPTFAQIKPVLYQDTHPFRMPPSYYLWIFRSAAYKSGYTGRVCRKNSELKSYSKGNTADWSSTSSPGS